ncbi:hypothetical protein Back11_38500 [Paenibacillus baekrokdamisoli]|uniref:Uncharacterized protein n=1 Tax=Paenibacillus baekrokdamisoli TaxID=1712516 RepID=A0A3G9J2B4_9BACL|nr:hypothetical protein [Paenibacillus baekrokdamisoli]MBB3068453.1 putative nucleotidyltransferase [Paenibacillus baekrokdamisoli]BBH22505.1 hypothetical protein Back11_38500 [Paenibacillus baekrokdamisoli]
MDTKQSKNITALYREALETFVEKIKNDDQVIAAILLGSMSYDQVWEKSDIDLKLIVHDQKLSTGYTCFVENDIPINTSIQTRNEFKRWLERSMQSSFDHSILTRSTLLFTKDASIAEYLEQIRHVGERDRELQLVILGSYSLSLLAKAEKWLYIKDDAIYSAAWIIKMVDVLAQIEVVMQGDIPMREVVQQALHYNPDLFHAIYIELVAGEVHKKKVEAALKLINHFLNQRAESLFQAILSYLKEEADTRTVTDLVRKFGVLIPIDTGSMAVACDWLAERGLIIKLEAETKATPKSRVPLLEPAYAYENEEMVVWMNG